MRRLDTPPYEFALPDEPHLRALFQRALREPSAGAREVHVAELRGAVCGLARRGKSAGLHVETIIVALKDIFGIPDRPNRSLRADEDSPPQTLLVRHAVRWCIEEYYGPGTGVQH